MAACCAPAIVSVTLKPLLDEDDPGIIDDTDEGISNRFDEYVNNVIPSMKYFEGKEGYTLYKINGEQSILNVHNEIINSIGLSI